MKKTILTLAILGTAFGAYAENPTYFPRAIDWFSGSGSKVDGWYNFTVRAKDVDVNGSTVTIPGVPAASYGGFPGNRTWDTPILSQVHSGSTQAAFTKLENGISGGAMPASGSLYFGGFSSEPNIYGGTMSITGSAISDLNTLLLQVAIGEAYTYDFYNHDFPILKVFLEGETEGTVVTLSDADILSREYLTTVSMPTGEGGAMEDQDVYSNLHFLQWDLSGYADIASYEITFSAVEHAQLYALQVNQGSSTDFTVVSEPSTYALMLAGGALAVIAVRRRSRSRT